jgi:Kdo2-lipid IVA lauroyltransferase/acyltransferase
MQAFLYFTLRPFIFIFSYLPFSVLYFLSRNLLYPVLYKMVGYRLGVVRTNLKNSFPNYSEINLENIESDFYKYLADMFVETLKSFTINQDALLQRVKLENTEILLPLFEKNKNVVITLGHIGNYELIAKAMPFYLKHKVLVPYHKMSNGFFNELFYKSRTAFGTIFFPTFDTFSSLKKDYGRAFAITLANDQSAPPTKSFWTRFLNQDTTFFVGTEKIAQQFDYPVVFAHITVPAKGYYTMSFELISDEPKNESEGFIMQKHAKLLEQDIKAAPRYWLWTHKRWKHKMPAGVEYGFNISKKS